MERLHPLLLPPRAPHRAHLHLPRADEQTVQGEGPWHQGGVWRIVKSRWINFLDAKMTSPVPELMKIRPVNH